MACRFGVSGRTAAVRGRKGMMGLLIKSSTSGLAFVEKFKLLLAGAENVSNSREGLSAEELPPGLSLDRVITDYLSRLSDFALEHLEGKCGKGLSKRDLQWCLTVPAIWDERAKQRMHQLAQQAGMVAGRLCPSGTVASPHPLLIVLEPGAASFFCLPRREYLQLRNKVYLGKGDQYMVVVIGGGTTAIMVHKKTESDASSMKVDEVTAGHGTGGLAGGTYVDKRFMDMVYSSVGCLQEFIGADADMKQELHTTWEQWKRS